MSEIIMTATPSGIADLFLGRIQDMSVPALFRLSGIKQLTGSMTFKHRDVRKDILLQEGAIIWVRTNQVDERLGQYLLCKGLISYEQFESCSRKVAKERKLGTLLVECGAIAASELARYLQGQALAIALELFDWTDGEFVVTHAPLLKTPQTYPAIEWRHLLIHGVRRISCWSKLVAGISDMRETRLRRAPDFQEETLPLDDTDRKVMALFDPGRSLVEAMKLKQLSDFDLFRSFWLLKLIGALTVESAADVPELSEPDEPGDAYEALHAALSAEWGERQELSPRDPLSDWFFPDVLRRIWQGAWTGHLEVELDDALYGFFFTSGDVAAAGRITDGKADAAGLPVGTQRVLDLSWRAATSAYGRAWFRPVTSEEKILPAPCMGTKELLFDCVDWLEDQDSIARHLKKVFGTLPLLKRSQDDVSDFFIGPSEGFILSLIDGKTSLDDLYLLSSLSESETARIVYQLFIMKLVEPPEPESPRDEEEQPAPAKNDGAERDRIEIERYLLEFASTMEQVDDLAVLGVDPDATEQDVKKAYLERIREFHPDRAPSEKARQICEKIVIKVMSCHETALERVRKQRDSRHDQEGAQGEPVLGGPAHVTELGCGGSRHRSQRELAESAYRQGQGYKAGGDIFNAIECFKIAVKYCPFDAPYRHALGQALATNPKWRNEAETHFLKVLEFEPRFVATYLALGALYRSGGKMSRAIEVFKKALFFDPANELARNELKKLQGGNRIKSFFSGLTGSSDSAADRG